MMGFDLLGPAWDDRWLIEATRCFVGCVEAWAYRSDFEDVCQGYRDDVDPCKLNAEIYTRFTYLRKGRHTGGAFPKHRRQGKVDYSALSEFEVDLLNKWYGGNGVASDRLPYTDNFETIYHRVLKRSRPSASRHEVMWMLFRSRRQGRLASSRR